VLDGDECESNPELERFAHNCVVDGRYNNVSEVVRAALRLLQQWEQRREQFTASLDEALDEADREGTFTVEEVIEEMDGIIDADKDWPRRAGSVGTILRRRGRCATR
jgi:antitoxin ParD1/3/4